MTWLLSLYVWCALHEPAWTFVGTWLALVLLVTAMYHRIVATRQELERRCIEAKLRRHERAVQEWRAQLDPHVRLGFAIVRGMEGV